MKVSEISEGGRVICPGGPRLQPKISLITPTYQRNGEGLLRRCLDSAVVQSFADFEHIIVDDGSDDGTEALVRDYASRDDRIVYVRHETNCGLPAVRTNEAILRTRGEAVAFLFDDNVLEPDFLERAWTAMRETGADVVHARVEFPREFHGSAQLGGFATTAERLRRLNTIANGGVLVRRELFDEIGLYDPHLAMRRICDWDLWLRALDAGARFHALDARAGTELGMVSPHSLGSTVRTDWRFAQAWMQDSARYPQRNARLRSEAIGDYDVLETAPLFPYVRDDVEWGQAIEVFYQPFLARHPQPGFDPAVVGNRAASVDPTEGWNAEWSLIKRRFRVAVVSNTASPMADLWARGLRRVPGCLVVECPEWELAAFSAGALDAIVLLDASLIYMRPLLELHRAAGVPVVYALEHGGAPTMEGAGAAERVDDLQVERLLNDARLYFPRAGAPFGEADATDARQVLALCDLLIAVPAAAKAAGLDAVEGPHRIARPAEFDAGGEDAEHWIADFARVTRLQRRLAVVRGTPVRPLKVSVFLHSELLAGSEVFGMRMAGLLSRLGVKAEVFIPDRSVYELGRTDVNDWLAEHGLPAARPAPYTPGSTSHWLPEDWADYGPRLEAFLEAEQPDVVFCSGYMAVFAAAPMRGRLLVQVTYSLAAYDHREFRALRGKVSAVASDSRWSMEPCAAGMGAPGRAIRFPLPPPPPQLTKTPAERDRGQPVRIGVAGTLQPRKRQLEAVQAVQRLLDQGYRIELNLYGYALKMMQDYIEAIDAVLAADPRLAAAVKRHGFVDSIDQITRENDVILSSSTDESLPTGVSMQMNRSLVACVVLAGGIDELVIDGVTGYLTRDPSPRGLADMLKRALDDEDRWPEIVAGARAHLDHEFSVHRASAELLELFFDAACHESGFDGALRDQPAG